MVAHLLASTDIAGALDLAFLVLGHILVVTTKRGDDGVTAVLVVVVSFAHDRLLLCKVQEGGRARWTIPSWVNKQ